MQLTINGQSYDHKTILSLLQGSLITRDQVMRRIGGAPAPLSIRDGRIAAFVGNVHNIRLITQIQDVQQELDTIMQIVNDTANQPWTHEYMSQSDEEDERDVEIGVPATKVQLQSYIDADLVKVAGLEGASGENSKIFDDILANVRQNLQTLIAAVPTYENDEGANDRLEDEGAKSMLPPRYGRKNMNVAAVTYAQGTEGVPVLSANTNIPKAMGEVFPKARRIIVDTTIMKHAEMKILDYFFEGGGGLNNLRYIGISKACCLGCAASLVIAQRNQVPALFKGTHGKTFGPGWSPPNYILKSQENLRAFLGNNAWKNYTQLNYKTQQHFILYLRSALKG